MKECNDDVVFQLLSESQDEKMMVSSCAIQRMNTDNLETI